MRDRKRKKKTSKMRTTLLVWVCILSCLAAFLLYVLTGVGIINLPVWLGMTILAVALIDGILIGIIAERLKPETED